jgi:hypothetical protein
VQNATTVTIDNAVGSVMLTGTKRYAGRYDRLYLDGDQRQLERRAASDGNRHRAGAENHLVYGYAAYDCVRRQLRAGMQRY